jgi:hypothetical protein
MTPERDEEIAHSGLTGQAELLARGEVTSRGLDLPHGRGR